MKYDYKAVEAKWQKVWEDERPSMLRSTTKNPSSMPLWSSRILGCGHVGHPRSYTALDGKRKRQNGYNVKTLLWLGCFGLPTENFAMKNHIHPAIVTKSNVIISAASRLRWLSLTGIVRSTPPTPSTAK